MIATTALGNKISEAQHRELLRLGIAHVDVAAAAPCKQSTIKLERK